MKKSYDKLQKNPPLLILNKQKGTKKTSNTKQIDLARNPLLKLINLRKEKVKKTLTMEIFKNKTIQKKKKKRAIQNFYLR